MQKCADDFFELVKKVNRETKKIRKLFPIECRLHVTMETYLMTFFKISSVISILLVNRFLIDILVDFCVVPCS